MAMLEITPVPLHRSQYPGELHLWVGGQSEWGATMWVPGGWGITVQYHNEEEPDLVKVAWPGPLSFWTKKGEPVLISSDRAPAPNLGDLAALEKLTGVALGAELLGHLGDMADQFDSSEGFATRNVRFTDPAMFNDLMVSLAIKAGAPLERATRTRVLETLLGDVNKNTAAQMDWYVTHGATSDDAYMAEIEEFSDLIAAYRAAIAAQMAG
jgi:hypothetical protein